MVRSKMLEDAVEVRTQEDVSAFLAHRFLQTGYNTIVDWLKALRLDMPHETASSILLSRRRKCGLKAFLQLASALEVKNYEMADILKRVYNDDLIWRRFVSAEVGLKEQLLLSKWAALTEPQQDLIFDMIKNMAGGAA